MWRRRDTPKPSTARSNNAPTNNTTRPVSYAGDGSLSLHVPYRDVLCQPGNGGDCPAGNGVHELLGDVVLAPTVVVVISTARNLLRASSKENICESMQT